MNTEARKQLVRGVRILGTGSYAPPKILTNADLEQMVDTSDEWIVTRTGIKERHIIEPGQAASDLAYPAGLKALETSGVDPKDLDAILVATVTGDYWFPSTSCLLQARFGATRAACMDLQAGCSGFLYAAQTARAMIRSGLAERILVIGVEILTKITNWKDRGTCILFGDAAGAAVFASGDEGHQVLGLKLGADGTNSSLIELPAGGTRIPITHEVLDQDLQYMRMKGNEVFKLGVRGMEDVARAVAEEAGVTTEDLALLIPHQANLRIIEATAKRLGLPPEKVFVNIHKYGNTSSASVPLALDEALAEGRIDPGDLVMMVVFGAGLTWGACLVRW